MRISATPAWIAVLAAAALSVPAAAQVKKKQVKDQREQDFYNQAIHADDPAKQIEALGAWTARYPESDYKDDRLYFYMQAYSKIDPAQPAKVLEYGSVLMSRDLRSVFNAPDGGMIVLNVLFLAVRSAAAIPDPSMEQLALGRRAARDLLQFAGSFKPPNTIDTDWAVARSEIEAKTRLAIIAMALAPGGRAMAKTPPDCAEAATLYRKAVEEFPANAVAAYSLGKALYCGGRMPEAIFQFFRAAQLDPLQFREYAEKLYIAYHGVEEGIDAVRTLAKTSLVPPADFRIETAAQAVDRKQDQFAREFPHLARWNAIREQLAAPYGTQYFDGQLKGAPLSLKGAVVEGRPACRPKELLVAIGPGARAEIAIRLDSALAGTAVAGEIEFTAVPKTFAKEPLLVTMDTDRTKIANLKIGPCGQ